MKEYKVEVTPSALDDIDIIYGYIVNTYNSFEGAEKVKRRILAKCQTLGVFPKIANIKMKVLDNEILFIGCGKYIIIYYIDEYRQLVRIIRVIHSRRNIMQIINE